VAGSADAPSFLPCGVSGDPGAVSLRSSRVSPTVSRRRPEAGEIHGFLAEDLPHHRGEAAVS